MEISILLNYFRLAAFWRTAMQCWLQRFYSIVLCYIDIWLMYVLVWRNQYCVTEVDPWPKSYDVTEVIARDTFFTGPCYCIKIQGCIRWTICNEIYFVFNCSHVHLFYSPDFYFILLENVFPSFYLNYFMAPNTVLSYWLVCSIEVC